MKEVGNNPLHHYADIPQKFKTFLKHLLPIPLWMAEMSLSSG
jgi:hypothetical protein